MSWKDTLVDIILLFLRWGIIFLAFHFVKTITKDIIIEKYNSSIRSQLLSHFFCLVITAGIACLFAALYYHRIDTEHFFLDYIIIGLPALLGMYVAFRDDKASKKQQNQKINSF